MEYIDCLWRPMKWGRITGKSLSSNFFHISLTPWFIPIPQTDSGLSTHPKTLPSSLTYIPTWDRLVQCLATLKDYGEWQLPTPESLLYPTPTPTYQLTNTPQLNTTRLFKTFLRGIWRFHRALSSSEGSGNVMVSHLIPHTLPSAVTSTSRLMPLHFSS